MKKIIPVFLFIIFPALFFSQGKKYNLDSIYKLIPSSHDTSKCKKLNLAARQLCVNEPDSSYHLADSARRLAQRIGFKSGLAYSYFLLGINMSTKGKDDQAIVNYEKSLEIYKKLGRKDDICNIYNSFGNLYSQKGDVKSAEANYRKAYEMAQAEPKSKYYIGIAGFGLALIETQKKEFTEAISIYSVCLGYFKELNMPGYVAVVLQNVSETYLDMKNYQEAKKTNDFAIEQFKALGDSYGLAAAYGTRSTILENEGNRTGAIESAEKAYELAVKIGNLREMTGKSKSVYLLYKANKDYKMALDYAEKLMQHNDSLQNEEQSKAFSEAETKYSTKEKEQELLLKNAELEKSELKVSQRNNLIVFFVGASVVFLVLLVLVYKQFTDKKKANNLLISQNEKIEKQKELIEEKNKDITDSINYSKHIQQAILPSPQKVKNLLPDSFVIFKPKDIVSGDFYLVEEIVGMIYLAVVDCTGHGVPGAMLSVFADSTVKNSIASNSFRDNPGALLSDLCFQFKFNLQSNNSGANISDGMDMSICIIDKKEKKMYYSGARNGLLCVSGNQVKEYPANRWGISGTNKGEHMFYDTHVIDLKEGDWFYLYSDGYADQFGGPKGKKFKQKQLTNLLLEGSKLNPVEQKNRIEKEFEEWKGALEQIDDITVVGFRI